MISTKQGVWVSNDGRVATAKSLRQKDVDDARKIAEGYDLEDARKQTERLYREPTPRELLTRTVKHADPRKQVVVQTQQQKTEEEFLLEQIAYCKDNPGHTPAEKASRKRELKRYENNLADLHKDRKAEQAVITEGIENLRHNPITDADRGRALHANKLLQDLCMCDFATREDCDRADERKRLRGTEYDKSYTAWKSDFIARVEQRTQPTPEMTVARAKELLEIRQQVKSMVEMPGVQDTRKTVVSDATIQLPPGMTF